VRYTNKAFDHALPAPTNNVVYFPTTGNLLSGLTVKTGSGGDNIIVQAVPTLQGEKKLDIQTGAGFNNVTLQALTIRTTVTLGDQDNRVLVQSADADARVTITGGAGDDTIDIQALGTNARITADAGVGNDVKRPTQLPGLDVVAADVSGRPFLRPRRILLEH
jgi:hypothetical protein